MISLFDVLVVLFVLFAISRVLLRFKEGVISIKDLLFWIAVWVIALIVIFLPATTTFLGNIFGIGRGIDLIVYVGLILLFYLVFRLYVKLDNISHDITAVVRKQAIQNPKKKR